MNLIAFFDLEIGHENGKILDIGCIRSDESEFHQSSPDKFLDFTKEMDFLCGHNIIQHDLKHLQQFTADRNFGMARAIDTLLLSPLLFPGRPYHRLVKDYKLQTEDLNNPLNDAKKARELFFDEVHTFHRLDEEFKIVLYNLLTKQPGFSSFFKYVGYEKNIGTEELEKLIKTAFNQKVCANCHIKTSIEEYPVALSYVLSLIKCNDRYSITPPWVLKNYPEVERILFLLRNNPCIADCRYCNESLNPTTALQRYFGFSSFRSYGGEPLQEDAVRAAIQNKSILTIFPTGGGKSITFQVPALISGENAKALTVVISPLQSLMKDQVDNLEKKSITEAVAINGLLDPIERSKAIARVEEGNMSLLYISPESLRSVTIERLLLKRKIARFVIDEAHCFSSWGHDFRVDYLYIGDFIKSLQEKKGLLDKIPVSCFTATAKLKVIEDIRQYFRDKLGIQLELFRANTARTNLHYKVFQKNSEEEKYAQLRNLIELKTCPVIVYVSRTKKAIKLAQRLTEDGFNARPYHGKMEKDEKTVNQNEFMIGEATIMVATSAFGMGVDKDNVGMVIHYDISDSLENYIQEAGRAGRDETISAECYILFNEEDLDNHFVLHNKTKIGIKEINQIWKALKDLTRTRDKISNSALEIARKAGWDESIKDVETRVTTAIAALENAKYLKRGQNYPLILASSIISKNAQEAIAKINTSEKFDAGQKEKAIRIIKKLFSSKSKRLSTDEIAESRVDYISDQLGITKEDVIRVVTILKEENVLAETKDLTAFVKRGENNNRSLSIVEDYSRLENSLLDLINEEETSYNLKDLNEQAEKKGVANCAPNKIKTLINFWAIKNFVRRQNLKYSRNHFKLEYCITRQGLKDKINKRHSLAGFIVEYLVNKVNEMQIQDAATEEILVEFSVVELKEGSETKPGLFTIKSSIDDVEDALFYLSRIGAINIEGGFLVAYNRLSIERLEKNNRIQYKESDYEELANHYRHKVQQIHIVGEYAKKMIRNYKEALQFVEDYFSLNYISFLNRYFPGSRQDEIKRTLTPEKFRRLFGDLSTSQLEIIKDSSSRYIVVAAGPGSGKTKMLVHKLASLLLAEDVRHEQLLMLTFSRAAASEFKKRLLDLVGNAANYIEIKTFHSFCFDLLGKMGNLEQSNAIIKMATERIKSNDIEINRITKSVLVLDEAQDMNEEEYELVKELMTQNEGMRVVMVGDDDQNIYEFREADSRFMQQLIIDKAATKYELTENYRSKNNIVDFTNQWAQLISNRLKTGPGIAKQQQDGFISITEYTNANLIVPLAESIQQARLSGSTGVLTQTNIEAIQLAGLLSRNGMHVKLIQSNDGFRLSNLYELRLFSSLLKSYEASPYINEEDWHEVARKLSTSIKRSSKSELSLAVIHEFESINPARKYRSDWDAFLRESRIEDFANIDSETIFVSTIHKAKGKEFENIFIMLNGFNPNTDEKRRQFYVAATRSKTNLAIHYNGNYFRSLSTGNLQYHHNSNQYPEPQQLAFTLTHVDVQLGYFSFVQHRINNLQSGDSLKIQEEGLANTKDELILKFSDNFKETLIDKKYSKYHLSEAKVNFIVFWKDSKSGTEVKIVLPEIWLQKGLI